MDHLAYKALGYDPTINILIEYRIKAAMYPEGDRAFPPSPKGMSGGGIFRVGSNFQDGPDTSDNSLIGIMHTFKAKERCFAGTRLPQLMQLIAARFPAEIHEFIGT